MVFYDTEFCQQLFAERISVTRKEKKLAVRSAAKEIGIGSATLTRLEVGGSYYPNIITYCKVCNWLGADYTEFLKEKVNE
jgi:transcriptional regulator with XRE-family HTH domain